jgi:hypothetical protein
VLRAQDIGLTFRYVPLILIAMNIFYATGGVASDHFSRRALLIGADLVLAAARSPLLAFVAASLCGGAHAVHASFVAKFVADTAPVMLRGTGFGIFNLVSGLALLLASIIAGDLWSAFGGSATFLGGPAFAATAALGLLAYRGGTSSHSAPNGQLSSRLVICS